MAECINVYIDTNTGLPVCGITALKPKLRPTGSGEQTGPEFTAPRVCIPAQLAARRAAMEHCSGNPGRVQIVPPRR